MINAMSLAPLTAAEKWVIACALTGCIVLAAGLAKTGGMAELFFYLTMPGDNSLCESLLPKARQELASHQHDVLMECSPDLHKGYFSEPNTLRVTGADE
ncbi:MAG: hypothetical protein EP312_04200, partial [Gammaproteobacteria bacterium]